MLDLENFVRGLLLSRLEARNHLRVDGKAFAQSVIGSGLTAYEAGTQEGLATNWVLFSDSTVDAVTPVGATVFVRHRNGSVSMSPLVPGGMLFIDDGVREILRTISV